MENKIKYTDIKAKFFINNTEDKDDFINQINTINGIYSIIYPEKTSNLIWNFKNKN